DVVDVVAIGALNKARKLPVPIPQVVDKTKDKIGLDVAYDFEVMIVVDSTIVVYVGVFRIARHLTVSCGLFFFSGLPGTLIAKTHDLSERLAPLQKKIRQLSTMSGSACVIGNVLVLTQVQHRGPPRRQVDARRPLQLPCADVTFRSKLPAFVPD